MKSTATTPEGYLAELPSERRETIAAVRRVILANLPEGYEESINWGMLAYEIPLKRYPDTYNDQPLGYVALASQKHYCALYLYSVYMSEQKRKAFEEAWRASGKKLDMGKSCVRFKTVDDLPLDVIAATVASTGVDEFLEVYESVKRR